MSGANGKPKSRTVHGVKCLTMDGAVWNWTIDNVAYSWCTMKQVRFIHPNGNSAIVAWVPSLGEAVALTVGYHDGKGLGQRTSLHLTHV